MKITQQEYDYIIYRTKVQNAKSYYPALVGRYGETKDFICYQYIPVGRERGILK